MIKRRHLEEGFFKILMILSLVLVAGSLGFILITVIIKGLPALESGDDHPNPKRWFLPGQRRRHPECHRRLALPGSGRHAAGAGLQPAAGALPARLMPVARAGRISCAFHWMCLWGIPSIVYGAFGFTLMLALGMRASLLGGILTLALLELPIMTRAMDEVIRMMPHEMEQASFAVGATRLETALQVVTRQMLPGILTAVLLAFGRGIGDAASVLFTAGYTDRMPTSLLRPVASLPLAVFFQLGTPFPEVQQRAYASALILTVIVLAISLGSRWLAGRLSRYTIRLGAMHGSTYPNPKS